jgi:hypothetical protein
MTHVSANSSSEKDFCFMKHFYQIDSLAAPDGNGENSFLNNEKYESTRNFMGRTTHGKQSKPLP